jgi:hypothetical protein
MLRYVKPYEMKHSITVIYKAKSNTAAYNNTEKSCVNAEKKP